ENILVQVKYSRRPVSRAEGQELTLKCTAEYEEQHCGNISLFWCLSETKGPCQPLNDPERYSFRIDETKITGDGGFRQQDAVITFTHLRLNDTGFYQCKASCQHSKATAMGHLINITV
ncbi:hypothetical protein C0J45_2164, partial [Silurus meridionalis]